MEMLATVGADTLVVTGCSTSHCVYATLRDAGSGFRVIVPREAVGERCELLHEVALFDIDLGIGDVVPVEEVLEYLSRQAPPAPPAGAGQAGPERVGRCTASRSAGARSSTAPAAPATSAPSWWKGTRCACTGGTPAPSPPGAPSTPRGTSSAPDSWTCTPGGMTLLREPHHLPKIRQGVTTELIGIDGNSVAPFKTRDDLYRFLDLDCGLNDWPPLPAEWLSVAELLRHFDGHGSVNVAYILEQLPGAHLGRGLG